MIFFVFFYPLFFFNRNGRDGFTQWTQDVMDEIIENELAKKIYFAALKVHQNVGPSLLESAYEECLYYELRRQTPNVS